MRGLVIALSALSFASVTTAEQQVEKKVRWVENPTKILLIQSNAEETMVIERDVLYVRDHPNDPAKILFSVHVESKLPPKVVPNDIRFEQGVAPGATYSHLIHDMESRCSEGLLSRRHISYFEGSYPGSRLLGLSFPARTEWWKPEAGTLGKHILAEACKLGEEAKQRQRDERDANSKAFRQSLKIGDETNCGAVFDLKPPMAGVQTRAGIHYIAIKRLFRKEESCRIVNGEYISPNEL